MNIGDIWKSLKATDKQISELVDSYSKEKSKELSKVLPGRRSTFFTAQEFVFPFTLTATGDIDEFTIGATIPTEQRRPLIMTTDGVYCLSRICYEVYLELQFNFTSGGVVTPRKRRDTMSKEQTGLSHWLITPSDTPAGLSMPCFDFEWKIEIGSNDRAYALDGAGGGAFGGENYLSRASLLGQNYKQGQFARPYYLDGNEFLTMSIRPTLVPFDAIVSFRTPDLSADNVSNLSMNIIVSMVTIGHKILGKTS